MTRGRAGWREMESPARLCRPSRQASRGHPRGKPGFSTFESGYGRETDSPLEGTGFEPSVPLAGRGRSGLSCKGHRYAACLDRACNTVMTVAMTRAGLKM
jgi:hypothetical protein